MSGETRHTPGPWGNLETESFVELEYPDGTRLSGWQDVGTADGHVVAIVPSKDSETYRDGDAVAEANAHLIAAAPALYEALTAARDIVEQVVGAVDGAAHVAREIDAALSSALPEDAESAK